MIHDLTELEQEQLVYHYRLLGKRKWRLNKITKNIFEYKSTQYYREIISDIKSSSYIIDQLLDRFNINAILTQINLS